MKADLARLTCGAMVSSWMEWSLQWLWCRSSPSLLANGWGRSWLWWRPERRLDFVSYPRELQCARPPATAATICRLCTHRIPKSILNAMPHNHRFSSWLLHIDLCFPTARESLAVLVLDLHAFFLLLLHSNPLPLAFACIILCHRMKELRKSHLIFNS